mgnify:CR=1 FL=1
MLTMIGIIILAYLLGSIPSGLLIGKTFYGIDIREHGSGNLGATNTFRVLGIKAGIVVTLMDILKGTLATALPMWFAPELHPLIAGLFAVIGHMYPVFAQFKGGKAVATSAGVLLCYEPVMFLFIFGVFFITLYLSKIVSLSSMVSSIAAVIYSFLTKDVFLIVVVVLLAAFVIYRHRSNIERIRNKTEPKIKWL